MSDYLKQYYLKYKDKFLARAKIRFLNKKTEILAKQKIRYERNKAKVLLRCKQYIEKNRVKVNSYHRLYARLNPEKKARWSKNYALTHKEALRAASHRRRGYGYITKKIVQMVYEDNIKRYGTLTCYLCLQPIEFGKDHLEHKTPLSRQGSNEYSNLAIACVHCNSVKGAKSEKEYRESLCLK